METNVIEIRMLDELRFRAVTETGHDQLVALDGLTCGELDSRGVQLRGVGAVHTRREDDVSVDGLVMDFAKNKNGRLVVDGDIGQIVWNLQDPAGRL
jgi:hypothetical protein